MSLFNKTATLLSNPKKTIKNYLTVLTIGACVGTGVYFAGTKIHSNIVESHIKEVVYDRLHTAHMDGETIQEIDGTIKIGDEAKSRRSSGTHLIEINAIMQWYDGEDNILYLEAVDGSISLTAVDEKSDGTLDRILIQEEGKSTTYTQKLEGFPQNWFRSDANNNKEKIEAWKEEKRLLEKYGMLTGEIQEENDHYRFEGMLGDEKLTIELEPSGQLSSFEIVKPRRKIEYHTSLRDDETLLFLHLTELSESGEITEHKFFGNEDTSLDEEMLEKVRPVFLEYRAVIKSQLPELIEEYKEREIRKVLEAL